MSKLTNDYARLIPGYDIFPKTVLAAIALSLAMRLEGEETGKALRLLITEWDTLHQNGIVPQRLPAGLRSMIENDHDGDGDEPEYISEEHCVQCRDDSCGWNEYLATQYAASAAEHERIQHIPGWRN